MAEANEKSNSEIDPEIENDPEIKKLKKEKRRAELEKSIAESDRDALKAEVPTIEAESPKGKLTVDENVSIECQIIAYKAMFEIAAQISKEIGEKKPHRIIICDQSNINALYSYRAFIEQISLLEEQYKKCEEVKVKEELETREKAITMATLAAGTTILNSFIGFASLFRTDTEIKGVKVEIDKDALIAEVARKLKSINITTVYPAFKTTVPSKFLNKLTELKEMADKKIEENADNKKIVKCLEDLNTQYSKLLTTLTSVDEKTGISQLEKISQGEILDSLLNNEDTNDITYMMYIKAVVAGGNNNIITNILRSKLYHSGGAIITYFLIDTNGDIKASNTHYNFSGYNEFKKEKNVILKNSFLKH